jgi:cell division protein FtsN
MREKEYREIQLSSTHLVLIIFGLLVVGCIIFLLGASVGKKQVQMAARTDYAAPTITDKTGGAVDTETVVQPKLKSAIKEELKSHEQVQEKSEPDNPPEVKQEAKQPATPSAGSFFIQVGAYSQKGGAEDHVEKLINQGFSAVILDPFPRDRRPIYRVRVGGYATRADAESALTVLAKTENKKISDYFIAQK